jgi:hypothetical protein
VERLQVQCDLRLKSKLPVKTWRNLNQKPKFHQVFSTRSSLLSYAIPPTMARSNNQVVGRVVPVGVHVGVLELVRRSVVLGLAADRHPGRDRRGQLSFREKL